MAVSRSGFGGYLIGAVVGLVFSVVALVVVSVVLPGPDGGGAVEEAADAAPVSAPVEEAAAEVEAAVDASTGATPAPDEPAGTSDGAEAVAEAAEAEAAESTEEIPVPDEPALEGDADVAGSASGDAADGGEAVAEQAAAPGDDAVEEAAEPAPATEVAAPTAEEPVEAPGGSEAAEATDSPEGEETAVVEVDAEGAVKPALKAHGERFTGDRSAPLLAIVLDQVGAPGSETDDVFLLPAPISLVIATDAPDRRELIVEARDAGFEAMHGFSRDTALGGPDALEALVGAGDPVIGLATFGEGLDDPLALAALAEGLSARGMALLDLTNDGGGQGYRLARGAGLPAAPLGRRFDQTPSSAAVYQALERAAFDARRTGAFVVVARPEPAVLQGLRRWMNVKANKSVDVAPLSTVIGKISAQ